jgi:hypothetical protein
MKMLQEVQVEVKQLGLHIGTSMGFIAILITFDRGELSVEFANEEDVNESQKHGEEFWVDAGSPHLGSGEYQISNSINEVIFDKKGDLLKGKKL